MTRSPRRISTGTSSPPICVVSLNVLFRIGPTPRTQRSRTDEVEFFCPDCQTIAPVLMLYAHIVSFTFACWSVRLIRAISGIAVPPPAMNPGTVVSLVP